MIIIIIIIIIIITIIIIIKKSSGSGSGSLNFLNCNTGSPKWWEIRFDLITTTTLIGP